MLIQIWAIFIVVCQHQPSVHCLKGNFGLKMSRRVSTPLIDHLYIYSLWYRLAYHVDHLPTTLSMLRIS